LIVVAEGAAPIGGQQQYAIKDTAEIHWRLGGIGYTVGNMIAQSIDTEIRVTVLGHVQRGGQPTPRDRWLATHFGATAVRFVAEQRWGQMVALQGTNMVGVPMAEAVKVKLIDPNGDLVQMARDLGIVFG
jgi:6-phosphofructokinase 1